MCLCFSRDISRKVTIYYHNHNIILSQSLLFCYNTQFLGVLQKFKHIHYFIIIYITFLKQSKRTNIYIYIYIYNTYLTYLLFLIWIWYTADIQDIQYCGKGFTITIILNVVLNTEILSHVFYNNEDNVFSMKQIFPKV